MFRAPSPFDPNASYCGSVLRDVPHGRIVELGDRIFHTCARVGSDRVRTVLNGARVPGLEYNLAAIATGVIYSDVPYESGLTRRLETNPDIRERIVLGFAEYTVRYDANRWVQPEVEGSDPVNVGNLYVYEGSLEGETELPPHHVSCNAEPKIIVENGAVTCFILFQWNEFRVRVSVWAGGEFFTPMEHEHFPGLVRDALRILDFVDVTDDPERQACVLDGGAWFESGCASDG